MIGITHSYLLQMPSPDLSRAWPDLNCLIFPGGAEEGVSRKRKGSGISTFLCGNIFPDRSMGTFLRQRTGKAFCKTWLRRLSQDGNIPSAAHLADTNTFRRQPFSLQRNVFPPATWLQPFHCYENVFPRA